MSRFQMIKHRFGFSARSTNKLQPQAPPGQWAGGAQLVTQARGKTHNGLLILQTQGGKHSQKYDTYSRPPPIQCGAAAEPSSELVSFFFLE